ncbi:MAG: hypothetical protein IID16_05305 [Candidatus Marinimicrobia bacterium]|nr:hypothetical protein [Candidatus Neomarinimicrobiota bacterium]
MDNVKIAIVSVLFILGYLSSQTTPFLLRQDENASLKRATQLERIQLYDEAEAIYKSLLEKNPSNTRAFLQLKSLYRRNNNFSALETLIKNRLVLFPNDLQSHIELGEVLLLEGEEDRALEYWENLILQYKHSQTAYRIMLQMYMKYHLDTPLKNLVTAGREQFNDPSMFSLELANAYQAKQQYKEATHEYITYALSHPRRSKTASQKILRMSDVEESRTLIKDVFFNRLNENESLIGRLYSDFLFKTGEYLEAFEQHDQLGFEMKSDFERWLKFAENLRKEQQYSLSLKAYSKILETTSLRKINLINKSPLANGFSGEALYGLALTYEQLILPELSFKSLAEYYPNNIFFENHFYSVESIETNRLAETFTLYDSILTSLPSTIFSPKAHFRIGEIKYRLTQDFDGALGAFRLASSMLKEENIIRKANGRIGDVLIAKGDLASALVFFNQLTLTEKSNENTIFYLTKKCQVQFLMGELDSALVLLNDLVFRLDLTNNSYNDILELRGFIEEKYSRADAEAKDAFLLYLEGEKSLKQANPYQATVYFSEVTNKYPQSPISVNAAFRNGKIAVQMGKYDEALTEFESIKESSFGDKTTVMLGEIYDRYTHDSKQAIQWYLSVLELFPESMLVEPVRYRIRELSQDREVN